MYNIESLYKRHKMEVFPSDSHLKLFHLFMFLIVFPFQPNKGSKKAKKSGSNIFSLFSQKQIQEFKEAFGIIDNDKDGIITAPDLKKAFEVSFKDMASFINEKRIEPFLLGCCITIDLVLPDNMETMVCLLCQRKLIFLDTF